MWDSYNSPMCLNFKLGVLFIDISYNEKKFFLMASMSNFNIFRLYKTKLFKILNIKRYFNFTLINLRSNRNPYKLQFISTLFSDYISDKKYSLNIFLVKYDAENKLIRSTAEEKIKNKWSAESWWFMQQDVTFQCK